MRKFIILALLFIIAATNSVFAQTAPKNINMNKEFTLSAKQKGYLKTGKITIEFISVLEDSRCPVDVDCVWAGSAKIQIKVSKGKAAAEIFELNTNLEPQFIKFQGYKIELTGLTPVPKSDVDMKSVKYTASFKIEK